MSVHAPAISDCFAHVSRWSRSFNSLFGSYLRYLVVDDDRTHEDHDGPQNDGEDTCDYEAHGHFGFIHGHADSCLSLCLCVCVYLLFWLFLY